MYIQFSFAQTHNIKLDPNIGVAVQKTSYTETVSFEPNYGFLVEYQYKNKFSIIMGVFSDPIFSYDKFFMLKIVYEEVEANEIKTSALNFPLLIGLRQSLGKKISASISAGVFIGRAQVKAFKNSNFIEPKTYSNKHSGFTGIFGILLMLNNRVDLSAKFRINKYQEGQRITEGVPRFSYFDSDTNISYSTLGYTVYEENKGVLSYHIHASVGFKLFGKKKKNCLK